ncbi:MAG: cytochrome c oxidase assembly protein [Methylosarcina sp.]
MSASLSAGLFWWSVFSRCDGTVLGVLLFTMIYTGMLGALLPFAQTPLYGDLLDLQDQQLAGLIMWVPGGLSYLITGVWSGGRWLQKIRPV